MHFTTHVIAGAALGLLIDRPLPSALAGVSGHLLLDVVPHKDPEHDITYVADAALGLALLITLARSRRVRAVDQRRSALWGAIGAGLPDLELTVKLFKYVEDDEYLFPTHNGTLHHRQAEQLPSTLIQAALLGGAALLVAARLKGRKH